MPLWHIDYFELKLLEKQPVQEGHFDSPLSPEYMVPSVRRHSYHRTWHLGLRRLPKQNYLISLLPKPKPLCHVNSSQIYCFLVRQV